MIGISPRQLEVFVAVAALGSVRAAAEQLHLTQPAASMALAGLERRIGVVLFDRARQRLHLNARGRAMLPQAREVLVRMQALERNAAASPDELLGELRIGASNT
ncbi:secreted protein containing Bacterial regulatory protein, LysR domain protein, partial [mine drainage metagenome]